MRRVASAGTMSVVKTRYRPTHCTDTYRVTNQDAEAGFVRDVFTATGHGSDGAEIEGQVAVVVPIVRRAGPHSTPSRAPGLVAASNTVGEHYLTPLAPRAARFEPPKRTQPHEPRHRRSQGWWWLLLILVAAVLLSWALLWRHRRHS